jgi:long-chain acyl-CoA synthetase
LDKVSLDGRSLVDLLRQSKKLFGRKEFMRSFRDGCFVGITYSEFADWAERIARGMLASGLRRGDKVAILSTNRPEWGAAYLGTLFAGGINVPLDALLKAPSWSHIIHTSGAKMLVISKSFLTELESKFDELPGLEMVVCMDEVDNGSRAISFDELDRRGRHSREKLPNIKPSDIASILYTSGTTGQAKGVLLSHENIVSDIDAMTRMITILGNDMFLSVLPIHHAFECTCGFLTPMAFGCCIVYARGLASKLIIEDIKSNQATILLGVPLLFEKMHDGIFKAISKKPPFTRVVFSATYSLSKLLSATFVNNPGKRIFKGMRNKAGLDSLRLLIAGGAPMPPEVTRAFKLLGFSFTQGYGLSEAAPVLVLNPIDSRNKDASIGLPLPGVELKIVDPDSRGIGQIVACGPMIMKGYYNNPEATCEVLKDGWLYTGDSGWVDNDGYFFIAGRLKNVIVTPAGKNVYPEEIESELNKSPYILESLVLGRPLEGTRGEEIEAIIVPDYEYFNSLTAETGRDYTTDEIERIIKGEVHRLSSGLAEFKKVKYIRIREDEFEKTSTKKIKRYLFTQKAEPVNNKTGKGHL